jgi:hypothetical protein
MGKFGWHSGYLQAQNLQSGSSTVSVDSNGDGTALITFGYAFKSTPIVVGNAQEADITGTICFKTIGNASAIVQVDGSSKTSSTLSIGWLAQDYSAN